METSKRCSFIYAIANILIADVFFQRLLASCEAAAEVADLSTSTSKHSREK